MKTADARAIASGVLRDLYTPRPRPGVGPWCESHVRIVEKGTGAARPGPWNTGLTPYWRQPLADLTDPKIRRITHKKSSQVGYSQLMLGFAMYCAGLLRKPLGIFFPTEDSSIRFNERRLIPTLEYGCPVTRGLVRSDRDIRQTQILVGGVPIYFGWAKSTRTAKSDPVANIIGDEIDEWPPGGELLSNLEDRQRTFDECKLLEGGTPEDEEAVGYVTWSYDNAQWRHRFCVPCPITGEFFELYDFDLLKWHGGRNADPVEAARETWLQSPRVPVPRHRVGETTEGRVDELHKEWMVRNGVWLRQGEDIEVTQEWVDAVGGARNGDNEDGTLPELSTIDATFLRDPARGGRFSRLLAAKEPDADTRRVMGMLRIVGGNAGAAGRIPSPPHVAYRINTLASLLDARGWGGVVSDGIRKRFGDGWQKGTLGRAPSIKGDIASVKHLRARCVPVDEGGYRIGELPDGVLWVSVGVDVQKTCVYLAAIAFGAPGTDPAVVGAARIARRESLRLTDIEDDLAGLRYRLAGANEDTAVPPMFVGIDSGHWQSDVWGCVERLRARGVKAWSMRGEAGQQSQHLYRVLRTSEKDEHGNETGRTHEVMRFHTDRWQTRVFAMLTEDEQANDQSKSHDGLAGLSQPEPVRLRFPEPWAFDDGRVSSDTGDFLAQITAERRVTTNRNGRVVQAWKPKREGIANHLGDAVRMAYAGAVVRGVEELDADKLAALIARMRDGASRPSPRRDAPEDAGPSQTPATTTAASGTAPRRAPRQAPTTIVSRMLGRRLGNG